MAFIPPRPNTRSTMAALLGGLFARDSRSMLSLLTERAYTVQMGVTRLTRKALFMVNAPDTVREVMVDRVATFPKHNYVADILQPLIGISIFNANGAQWQVQRRLIDQAMVQAGLRRAFPLMQAAVNDLMTRLEAAPRARLGMSTRR